MAGCYEERDGDDLECMAKGIEEVHDFNKKFEVHSNCHVKTLEGVMWG